MLLSGVGLAPVTSLKPKRAPARRDVTTEILLLAGEFPRFLDLLNFKVVVQHRPVITGL